MNMRSVRNWWEVWDIQVVTISSLLLQILLIFSAPLRKRVSTGMIVFPMWLAYLLADAVPVYAMGLISHRKSSSCCSEDLFVFWAPFLLLHLGGPDTITAFALEDNELWHRHLLNLVVQCCVFLSAFYLSFPGNKLWLPTVLIFIAGFIKYAERTCCLYLASFRGLANSMLEKPDPGPDYAELMNTIAEKKKAGLPVRIDYSPDPFIIPTTEERPDLSELEVILRAHKLHKTFKGMIADQRVGDQEWLLSRDYFLRRNATQAFKIVEVELNFFYEILYTKVLVVQGKYGFPLRIASLALISVTLALFNKHDKEGYKKFDVGHTYALLGGAIALDAIASLMVPFSDWCAVLLSEPHGRYNGGIYYKKLRSKLIFQTKDKLPLTFSTHDPILQNLGRTWSESIPQYNLLDHCLRPRSNTVEKTMGLIGLRNILDSMNYVKRKGFGHDLRDLIFDEPKMKSSMAEDFETTREIDSARGHWILRMKGCTDLLGPWIDELDYDESILQWQIATDLLLYIDDTETEKKSTTQGIDTNGGSPKEMDFKGLSKVLSNYMLYLLIMQTTVMSTVAGIAQKRYNDTCAEAKQFFQKRNIGQVYEEKNIYLRTFKMFCGGFRKEIQDEVHANACNSILSVNTAVKPSAIRGDRSKFVLLDASMLAKLLVFKERYERIDKWSIICKVWIEMMCYAACHCKGSTHAAQLSKGGQLITLVWLLMALLMLHS